MARASFRTDGGKRPKRRDVVADAFGHPDAEYSVSIECLHPESKTRVNGRMWDRLNTKEDGLTTVSRLQQYQEAVFGSRSGGFYA